MVGVINVKSLYILVERMSDSSNGYSYWIRVTGSNIEDLKNIEVKNMVNDGDMGYKINPPSKGGGLLLHRDKNTIL